MLELKLNYVGIGPQMHPPTDSLELQNKVDVYPILLLEVEEGNTSSAHYVL